MARRRINCPGRPRRNPNYNRASKAQRLRRSREALIKLCESQQIMNESFQNHSQMMTNLDSVPTSIKVLNPHEEKRTSDFLQNMIIKDSFTVIKTEIFDPSEQNPGLIFQDDSQYATSIDPMPVANFSRINQELLLPNVKVEPCSETPFLPLLPQENRESISSKKDNINFNHAVHCNKVFEKNFPIMRSKSDCSCFEKIATIRDICERYLELVQGNTNNLCLCRTGNNTLLEDIESVEKLMKKLSRLLNPES